jgi:hypothetical protein
MKKSIKYSIVAMVLNLTMVSFAPGITCLACSERLTYHIQGTWSDNGSANINVTGNYIDVRWDVANVYTGGTVDVYIRDNSGNDRILKNGRNQVSPGNYFLHMDWRYLLSADVTVTFECGSNADENYRLNRLWPSENVIRAELREFLYNNKNTSISEAKEMLIYLGAGEISLLTSDYVSGTFYTGAEITIWPNTYNKQSCYGIRYGKPLPGRPYFGSNNTYFEICK